MTLVKALLPPPTGASRERTPVLTAEEPRGQEGPEDRKAAADELKKYRNVPKAIYDAPRPPGLRREAAAKAEGLETPEKPQ